MEHVYFGYFMLFLSVPNVLCQTTKPNIVFILADDFGWNDVSYHGSDQVMTPNIDLLAFSGVALERYYTHAICTPTRSAFLTGKYSHKIGMQGFPLVMSEDRGIPIKEVLLPTYLKNAGYATHLVGKWHVGLSRNEYLPTSRGFDSHFGHRGGYLDYYDYTTEENFSPYGTVRGMSLFSNLTPAWETEGYLTDVYTERAVNIIEKQDPSKPLFLMVSHHATHSSGNDVPLQAPLEEIKQQKHITSTSRRIYAAMVKRLDDGVGEIVKALYDKNILNNTIIVFSSDNGGMTVGPYNNSASNYPLRGIKMSPFEGGVRAVGLVWSANLNNTKHYWNGYMHVSDWMPTLLTAAGIDIPLDIDGINHWRSINTNAPSKRSVIYEIDDYSGYSSIISGQYKLVTGNVTKSFSLYLGGDLRGINGQPPSYHKAILKSTVNSVLKSLGRPFDMFDLNLRNKINVKCNSISTKICIPDSNTVCLYNIIKDPCEITDLARTHPDLVRTMLKQLKSEIAKRIPRVVPFYSDPLSFPYNHNNTWVPWLPDTGTNYYRRYLLNCQTRIK